MTSHPTHEQIINSPAEHAPPGATQDLVHPWSMEQGAMSAIIAIYIITTLFVLTRVYAQLRVAKRFVAEDYVLLMGWVVYTAAFVPVGTLLARAHMGVHQWNITVGQLGRYLFLQYVEFIIWGILLLLLKVSILLQYLRIFVPDGIRDFTFWACHIVLWANICYYIAFTFIFMFVCAPRAMFWDKTITHGKCLDIFGINVISAVICVVSDIMILLLPQARIYQLNLTLRKKIGLTILFAIGIFACATSAVRLYYNIHLWKHQQDITYQLGYISFWGTAQIPAGFLVVCLPSVPKAINHLRVKPWFLRVEMSIRSRLHLSTPQTGDTSTPRLPTIGGGGPKRGGRAMMVSDIEFDSLVNKTQTSIVSRMDSGGQT